MSCGGSLLARWRRFIGRLPPAHAALFQLLLLALLAANIAGVVINVRRMQRAYQSPASLMSVHRLSTMPPLSLLLRWMHPDLNVSCVSGWADTPCFHRSFAEDGSQLFASQDGQSVSDGGIPFRVQLSVSPSSSSGSGGNSSLPAVDPGCVLLIAFGIPFPDVRASTYREQAKMSSPSSRQTLCFADQTQFTSIMTFAAVQSTEGIVSYSVALDALPMEQAAREVRLRKQIESMDGFASSISLSQADADADAPATEVDDAVISSLIFRIQPVAGLLLVPWELQEVMYPWTDFLVSCFAYLNISLTIVGVLFPYRFMREGQRRGREFQLSCSNSSGDNLGEGDDATDDDHVAGTVQQQHLQQRMLPRGSQIVL